MFKKTDPKVIITEKLNPIVEHQQFKGLIQEEDGRYQQLREQNQSQSCIVWIQPL